MTQDERPPGLSALIAGMKWINWIGLAVAIVVVLLVLLQVV